MLTLLLLLGCPAPSADDPETTDPTATAAQPELSEELRQALGALEPGDGTLAAGPDEPLSGDGTLGAGQDGPVPGDGIQPAGLDDPAPGADDLPSGLEDLVPGADPLSPAPSVPSLEELTETTVVVTPEDFGGGDTPDNGLPPMPKHADPSEESWWGAPTRLTLDPASAGEMLVGEWTQVRTPSQEHSLKLLGWLLQEPEMTAEQLAAEALDAADLDYMTAMQALLREKPETRALLEAEQSNQAHVFRLTMTGQRMTLITRKTTLNSDYTIESVHQDEVTLARTRITGADTTTMITIVDADRIRVQPHTDEPLLLLFSR